MLFRSVGPPAPPSPTLPDRVTLCCLLFTAQLHASRHQRECRRQLFCKSGSFVSRVPLPDVPQDVRGLRVQCSTVPSLTLNGGARGLSQVLHCLLRCTVPGTIGWQRRRGFGASLRGGVLE